VFVKKEQNMRISHKYKFIFLAYPRTASGTIRKLLDPYSEIKSVNLSQSSIKSPFHDHISAVSLKNIFDQRDWAWDEYQRFCVVRNPWDRMYSLFLWRKSREGKWLKHYSPKINLANIIFSKLPERIAFPFFIMSRFPKKGSAKTLHSFISDFDEKILVNKVLKFENLAVELPHYLSSIGIPGENLNSIEAQHTNKGRASYIPKYNDLTKQRVQTLFRYEIERFDYAFGR
jgi:hypothetical protein